MSHWSDAQSYQTLKLGRRSYFMHNDGSTKNFDISGEFYVEHAGDTVLVAPGGYYHLHYEIFDRSVHLIAESSDSIESAVFADSSFISIRGRVPHFTFKGFTVQNNQFGFLEINDYFDQWSPTHVNITDNIFRNNDLESKNNKDVKWVFEKSNKSIN